MHARMGCCGTGTAVMLHSGSTGRQASRLAGGTEPVLSRNRFAMLTRPAFASAHAGHLGRSSWCHGITQSNFRSSQELVSDRGPWVVLDSSPDLPGALDS